MKSIKYKISEKQQIGLIPHDSIINCFLMYEDDDSGNCLIYIPRRATYIDPHGEEGVDVGCGSLSFAKKCPKKDYYIKSSADYVNLKYKDEKLIETSIKKVNMTENQFDLYTEHLWKMREYLWFCEEFEYPWYGGLKSKFNGSSEWCDAMQSIWVQFIRGHYKTIKQFQSAYKTELKKNGVNIKD